MSQKFGLTRSQQYILSYIKKYAEENDGSPPTFSEMSDHAGLASKSGIYRIVQALQDRGHISRLPGKARSIVVLK